MFTSLKLKNIKTIEVEMTVQMSLEQWLKLRNQLKSEQYTFPAAALVEKINELVEKVEREYHNDLTIE